VQASGRGSARREAAHDREKSLKAGLACRWRPVASGGGEV